MISLHRTIAALAMSVAAMLPMPTRGQGLGTEFTYQGELRDAGSPINGNVDFEFRLFDAAANGNQLGPPRALNGHPVSNGVFTAALDFGDQFTGARRWLEIGVRRSGQPTFTVLQPRQSIKATPYALHAEFIADNSIDGASIADGSITNVDLAGNSVNSLQIVNGAVGTLELADASVTTPKIADGAVTAGKLAAGAIGSAQINTAQVQQRIAGRCPTRLQMVGVLIDGSPACDTANSEISSSSGSLQPIVALRTGDVPIVAMNTTISQGYLEIVSCADDVCATTSERTAVDSDIGAFTHPVDIAVRENSNMPFIVYRDVNDDRLEAIDCDDPQCSTRTTPTLDSDPGAGTAVALALRGGNLPFIVHRVGTEIRAIDCADDDCFSRTRRTLISTDVDASSNVAVVLTTNDVPVVFFEGTGVQDGLNVYDCIDDDCTSGGRIDLNDDNVTELSAAMRSSSPIVVYRTPTSELRVLACTGTLGLCPGGGTTVLSPAAASGGVDLVVQLDGNPLIVFYDGSSPQLYACSNSACTSGVLRRPDFDAGPRGRRPSIALRNDGRPVLAYEAEVETIRVVVCGNLACVP